MDTLHENIHNTCSSNRHNGSVHYGSGSNNPRQQIYPPFPSKSYGTISESLIFITDVSISSTIRLTHGCLYIMVSFTLINFKKISWDIYKSNQVSSLNQLYQVQRSQTTITRSYKVTNKIIITNKSWFTTSSSQLKLDI